MGRRPDVIAEVTEEDMKLSGFSFARNADTFYYPIAESIRSVLPVCDEFVIAIGKGDPGDRTRELVAAIGDPRIRIIDTEWSQRETLRSRIYSQQTNLALGACTGDWCLYIQADEVVHEQYLPAIRARCEQLAGDREVEALLFRFRHFWGDYRHYLVSHKWYPREIRIVRNGLGVESTGDAQSFRLDGRKLRVAAVDAEVFHYGYVRPPDLMFRRTYDVTATYWGQEKAREMMKGRPKYFDYGSLAKLPRYTGTIPEVLRQRASEMHWADRLQYDGQSQTKHKHERFKYTLLTFIEQKLFGGRAHFGYKNYVLLKGK
jgi:hypothetical protein